MGVLQAVADRARLAGIPRPRAFAIALAGLGAIFAGILLGGVLRNRTPAAMVPDLNRAETLAQDGDLKAARAILEPLKNAHPEVARVHYLIGHVAYAEGNRERALGEYARAVQLDSNYRDDTLLLGDARALLDRKGELAPAVALYQEIGRAALPDLEWCARSCRSDKTRKAVQELIGRLDKKR